MKKRKLIKQSGQNLLFEISSGSSIIAYEVCTTKTKSKTKFGTSSTDGYFPYTFKHLAFELYESNVSLDSI